MHAKLSPAEPTRTDTIRAMRRAELLQLARCLQRVRRGIWTWGDVADVVCALLDADPSARTIYARIQNAGFRLTDPILTII